MNSAKRAPAPAIFFVSAVFHYLGPSFAVLLFAHLQVLGVAWLRIASAAAIFALWRRPVRDMLHPGRAEGRAVIVLGTVLAAMNACFYLAIARLPLSTVGAIEFLGTVVLAAYGLHSWRNVAALCATVLGVGVLANVRLAAQPLGMAFAFLNCALFVLYVVLGHRLAQSSANIEKLAASMLVAALAITPFGLAQALPALRNPQWLLAGVAVGACSSVIPYVTDQLAMAKLPRATFSLMLALLPVFATLIGAVVLHQIPTIKDVAGIALVTSGVALHRQE